MTDVWVGLPLCECRDGCQCQASPGPAAVILRRGPRVLNACTRCQLPGDVVLDVTFAPDTPMAPYWDYDWFGLRSTIREHLARERHGMPKG